MKKSLRIRKLFEATADTHWFEPNERRDRDDFPEAYTGGTKHPNHNKIVGDSFDTVRQRTEEDTANLADLHTDENNRLGVTMRPHKLVNKVGRWGDQVVTRSTSKNDFHHRVNPGNFPSLGGLQRPSSNHAWAPIGQKSADLSHYKDIHTTYPPQTDDPEHRTKMAFDVQKWAQNRGKDSNWSVTNMASDEQRARLMDHYKEAQRRTMDETGLSHIMKNNPEMKLAPEHHPMGSRIMSHHLGELITNDPSLPKGWYRDLYAKRYSKGAKVPDTWRAPPKKDSIPTGGINDSTTHTDKFKILFLEHLLKVSQGTITESAQLSNLKNNYTFLESIQQSVVDYYLSEGFFGRLGKFGKNFIKGAVRATGPEAIKSLKNIGLKQIPVIGNYANQGLDAAQTAYKAATDDSPETKVGSELAKNAGNTGVGMARGLLLKKLGGVAGAGLAKVGMGAAGGALPAIAAMGVPSLYRAARRGVSHALDQDPALRRFTDKKIKPFRPAINFMDKVMGHKKVFEPHPELGKKAEPEVTMQQEPQEDRWAKARKFLGATPTRSSQPVLASKQLAYRNGVKALFESVLDQLNEKDDKAVEGPVGTVQGQQVRATQLSTDYLAKRRANVNKRRQEKGLPATRAVYAQPENSSTQITYRNGIKSLFETVVDELREGGSKRLAMDAEEKKNKPKGKPEVVSKDDLPALGNPHVDKPNEENLEEMNGDTPFHRRSDLLMSVAGAATGDEEHIEALNNHPHGEPLLNHYNSVFNRVHKQLRSGGYHPDANGIAHREAYESTRQLINNHRLDNPTSRFPH